MGWWKQKFSKPGGAGHRGHQWDFGGCDIGPQSHTQHRRLSWQGGRHHWGINLIPSVSKFWHTYCYVWMSSLSQLRCPTNWLCCDTGQRLWLWVGFQSWGWRRITGSLHYLLNLLFSYCISRKDVLSLHIIWYVLPDLYQDSITKNSLFTMKKNPFSLWLFFVKFATRCSPMQTALASIDWQLMARKMTGRLYNGWKC